ncbi:hypothetical protein [Streptomyces lavendofoliae]|uniref:hypothetical protein n=1 Tax=Streptomyces lavendofoliae TaxID=67314 RepID=UPI00300EF3B8
MDAHRLVRTGVVAAAGAAAALALAGCGGGPDQRRGDDTAGGRPADGPPPSPAAAPAASPSPSPSVPPATTGAADGSWVGLTGGKPVSVTVKKGHALVLAEAHVCQGTARGTGTVALTLTCDDGYTTRTEGSARTQKGALVVTWTGGIRDTLTRAGTP